MGMSPKEVISVGLAHQLVMALTKRGVTKEMIASIASKPEVADRVSSYIKSTTGTNRKVNSLGLPTYVEHALWRGGIVTVGDLLALSEFQLTVHYVGLGKKAVEHINIALIDEGYPPLARG